MVTVLNKMVTIFIYIRNQLFHFIY